MKSTRVKPLGRLPPVVALLLAVLVGCGESQAGVELSLGTVLARPIEAQERPVEGGAVEPAVPDGPVDALVPCGDVMPLRPSDAVGPTGSVDLDTDLISLLSGYGEANAETFAGLWLDSESSGGVLLAFTDGIETHRDELMAKVGGAVGDARFSVVEAAHSRGDLESTLEAALRLGNRAVDSGTVDLQRNRVVLNLIGPTAEELANLTVAVDLDQVCSTITALPEMPQGPLEVLGESGDGSLLSCDGYPFPAEALEQPLPVADAEHPAVVVLAGFIEGDPDWIVLSEGSDHALFAKYDGELRATALATQTGGGWEIAGWTFGCDLKVGLPLGLGAVEVFLDPDSPRRPAANHIDVLVSEVACAGGRAMGERLLDPQIVETETEVILAFGAASQDVEFLDCPGNPATSVRIELDEPLGSRRVVDGMFIPPRPLGDPWFG